MLGVCTISTGLGFTGRYLVTKIAKSIWSSDSLISLKYCTNGLKIKIDRREAPIIHGKLPDLKKVQETHKGINCSDRGASTSLAEDLLNEEMLHKLEKLSGIRFQCEEEVNSLREDIQLANRIFELNTEGVEPLFNVVEDFLTCPLREDIPEQTSKDATLRNATVTMDDFFVTPKSNIPIKRNKLFLK